MKLKENSPPRIFHIGEDPKICISDCAHIELEPDEQVTFITNSGAQYDVARKSWGFYATPSLNMRLKKFGLRGVLVKGAQGNYHIWLVEKGKEEQLNKYLANDPHKILTWLEKEEDFAQLDKYFLNYDFPNLNCVCGSQSFKLAHEFVKPPEKEISFRFVKDFNYYSRKLFKCDFCGHFISIHDMDTGALYDGDYVDANYHDANGLKKTFNKIISLPKGKSDNQARVNRIQEFSKSFFPGRYQKNSLSLLDIGSGLCVFPYEMKQLGWNCTAIDTDPRQTEHAQKVAKIKAFCGDFTKMSGLGQFDIITYNRVLEHIPHPVDLLKHAKNHLKKGGFVYIELPDGETAFKQSTEREEFTIDHPHIFSFASAAILASESGFEVKTIKRLTEPSNKYSLIMFLSLK